VMTLWIGSRHPCVVRNMRNLLLQLDLWVCMQPEESCRWICGCAA